MSAICEGAMLACFGISWPINLAKSLHSRTAKGKSVFFEIIIIAGYLFGVAGKILSGNINIVLSLYFINIIMVSADLVLTFRNKHLDALAEQAELEEVTEERNTARFLGSVRYNTK